MNQSQIWYVQLQKPWWSPPSEVFKPVWLILYAIIAVTFIAVFYKVWKGELPKPAALPFVLNLVFNFLFTPIQFGLQNNFLAALDILLVLATLVWMMRAVWMRMKWVALANIPYLVWVSFATVLQLTITWLNL